MEIIVHQKLKWKFFYKIVFLFSLPIVANACKPDGLNNLCDLKSEGGLYVADSPSYRVLYFPVGSTTATRVYGQSNFTTNTLSIASATALNNPTWIALDQSENLYVSDSGNNRVVVFPKSTQTAGHTAVAVFGQYNNLSCAASNNVGGCTGGSVNPASLFAPSSITFNRQGQLYINDQNNHRILVL